MNESDVKNNGGGLLVNVYLFMNYITNYSWLPKKGLKVIKLISSSISDR